MGEDGHKETLLISGGCDADVLQTCAEPVEVVHAFGTCPLEVRENMCILEDARVVYAVGSRVAVTDTGGNSDSLTFLRTGLRVRRVSAVACSPDKRFVAVCYKAVGEPFTAYATVYHMPTRPRPSRVKTVSYERRNQERDGDGRCVEDRGGCTSGSGNRRGRSAGGTGTSRPRAAQQEALFVAACFSHDGRLLAALDGDPDWTLVWFEWKSGTRVYTLELRSPVHRMVFSSLDQSKMATAGASGLFRIWRTQAGKVAPMAPIAGLREVRARREIDIMGAVFLSTRVI